MVEEGSLIYFSEDRKGLTRSDNSRVPVITYSWEKSSRVNNDDRFR